jgi:hypothetical protein
VLFENMTIFDQTNWDLNQALLWIVFRIAGRIRTTYKPPRSSHANVTSPIRIPLLVQEPQN